MSRVGLEHGATLKRRARQSGILLAVMLTYFGFSDTGYAQAVDPVLRSQGVIDSVNCQGLSFVINGPAGSEEFLATQYTAVRAHTGRLQFCELSRFLGAVATVWSTTSGTPKIAGRIDVLVFSGSDVVPGTYPDHGHNDAPPGPGPSSPTGGSPGSGGTGNPHGNNGLQ